MMQKSHLNQSAVTNVLLHKILRKKDFTVDNKTRIPTRVYLFHNELVNGKYFTSFVVISKISFLNKLNS